MHISWWVRHTTKYRDWYFWAPLLIAWIWESRKPDPIILTVFMLCWRHLWSCKRCCSISPPLVSGKGFHIGVLAAVWRGQSICIYDWVFMFWHPLLQCWWIGRPKHNFQNLWVWSFTRCVASLQWRRALTTSHRLYKVLRAFARNMKEHSVTEGQNDRYFCAMHWYALWKLSTPHEMMLDYSRYLPPQYKGPR